MEKVEIVIVSVEKLGDARVFIEGDHRGYLRQPCSSGPFAAHWLVSIPNGVPVDGFELVIDMNKMQVLEAAYQAMLNLH